jgi:hypothetical protein
VRQYGTNSTLLARLLLCLLLALLQYGTGIRYTAVCNYCCNVVCYCGRCSVYRSVVSTATGTTGVLLQWMQWEHELVRGGSRKYAVHRGGNTATRRCYAVLRVPPWVTMAVVALWITALQRTACVKHVGHVALVL